MTAPIVTLEQGKLKGRTAIDYLGGNFLSFQGIPYAKAPIGNLRFKAPLQPEPWEGTFDATKEGQECPSAHMYFKYYVGSEDNCLNLNVYTKELPKPGSNPLKPVMVYIHGGAFLYGSNKTEYFGPDHLMTEDIVLVVINYRIGIFGFLSFEDPSLGVPGNAGLKDMVMALKWVQKNISNFTGDPHNVTIFGESAGAASVHYLVLSPLAKGLFHKAIAQSGSAVNCWAKCAPSGREIAKCLNFKENDERKILEYLREIHPKKLVKAQAKVPDSFSASTTRYIGPVVEKPSNEPAFITQDPLTILKSGNYNKVPLIMGYTSEEGLFYELLCKAVPGIHGPINCENDICHDFNLSKNSEKSLELANNIKKFYFGETKPESNMSQVYKLKSDTQFVYGIQRSVDYHKKSPTPVYLYRMSLETHLNYYKKLCSTKSITSTFLFHYLTKKAGSFHTARTFALKLGGLVPVASLAGVCHADDLGYLFKTFMSIDVQPKSIEDTSIKRFVKLWTNFAKTGNPTPNPNDELLNVDWKPVENDKINFLDIGEKLTCDANSYEERKKFWDRMYALFTTS